MKKCVQSLLEQRRIHKTVRDFGGGRSVVFYGLAIPKMSVQSLFWILKNVSLSQMQPNVGLVHSKFKEYFGLLIPQEK